MKVMCQNCGKVYDIPDKRLPFGQEITFPCQACKNAIKIDLRAKIFKEEMKKTAAPQPAAEDNRVSASQEKERGLPEGDALKAKILRSIEDLPSMPQTILKARQVMADPNSGLKDIAEILETDQGIATRVLRLANSSYYGRSSKVSSLEQASVLLGHTTLAEIISVASTAKLLDVQMPGYGMESGALWRHSLAVAIGSQFIAQKFQPALSYDAFLSGLIHDSGKLILDHYIAERRERFQRFMDEGRESYRKAEKHLLGFDHAEIAADVCRKWSIPSKLMIGVRYHHYPSRAAGNHLAYIVHLADALAIMSGIGISLAELDTLDQKALELLSLAPEELEGIKNHIVVSVEKITARVEDLS